MTSVYRIFKDEKTNKEYRFSGLEADKVYIFQELSDELICNPEDYIILSKSWFNGAYNKILNYNFMAEFKVGDLVSYDDNGTKITGIIGYISNSGISIYCENNITNKPYKSVNVKWSDWRKIKVWYKFTETLFKDKENEN